MRLSKGCEDETGGQDADSGAEAAGDEGRTLIGTFSAFCAVVCAVFGAVVWPGESRFFFWRKKCGICRNMGSTQGGEERAGETGEAD